MNTNFLFYALVLSLELLVGFAHCQNKSPNNHALIVAIGNYPADSGWPTISSKNDVGLIKKALEVQNFDDIKVLQDQAATVKGISDALEELIARSKPGDVDIIHFSSHGEQIEDLKRHKADGLEESIVTIDAKIKLNPTQDEFIKMLPGYFREDLFGSFVDRLRVKLGSKGDLIVFLDFCHAGIGTRGSAKVRGGRGAFVSPLFNSKNGTTADIAAAFSDGDTKADESHLATYVVFGAARPDELDYETVDAATHIGYGSLTYAVSKALTNLTTQQKVDLTYRSLFAQVQSVMNENASYQHPVLAGNGVDRTLFGGHAVVQKFYITIDQIKDKYMTIKGGTLTGLDSGAKVAIYPVNTNDPKKATFIDTGTVIKATLYNAVVSFNKPIVLKKPADGWVFVTSVVFKSDPTRIAVISNKARGVPTSNLKFAEPDRAAILKGLATISGIALEGTPELEIRKGTKIDSIVLSQTGLLFDTIKSAASNIALLKSKINRYMQYSFLKAVIVSDPDALVDVKLIPLIRGKVDSAKIKMNDNSYSFKDGDKFRLLITNKGSKDVYVNILDMQPDGVINPVIPNSDKKISPEELLFPAGSSRLFNNAITVSPPYGKEIFKIFVSTDMINMEEIANNRGSSSRGNLKAFEKLLQKSYGQTTRGATIDLGDANGSTYNLVFDIIK